jgi:hypothetical protein
MNYTYYPTPIGFFFLDAAWYGRAEHPLASVIEHYQLWRDGIPIPYQLSMVKFLYCRIYKL